MPPISKIESINGEMIGASVDGWLVLFGRRGHVGEDVTYSAPEGKTNHLVVDLKRNAKYKICGIVGGDIEKFTSQEGTLHFSTDLSTKVKLLLQK
jgi:hypothetical protein